MPHHLRRVTAGVHAERYCVQHSIFAKCDMPWIDERRNRAILPRRHRTRPAGRCRRALPRLRHRHVRAPAAPELRPRPMRTLVLLLVALAACSRPSTQQAAAELPPAAGASVSASAPAPVDALVGFELTVKRTSACYGCARFAESLHVDSRGRVKKGTEPQGLHDTGTLARADLLRIVRAFDAGLAEAYPEEATDGSTYLLELRSDGRVMTIEHAFGNRHVPKALLDLEQLIQDLTGLRMQ